MGNHNGKKQIRVLVSGFWYHNNVGFIKLYEHNKGHTQQTIG